MGTFVSNIANGKFDILTHTKTSVKVPPCMKDVSTQVSHHTHAVGVYRDVKHTLSILIRIEWSGTFCEAFSGISSEDLYVECFTLLSSRWLVGIRNVHGKYYCR